MRQDVIISGRTRTRDQMDVITRQLETVDSQSSLLTLVQGYWALESKDYMRARNLLSQGESCLIY